MVLILISTDIIFLSNFVIIRKIDFVIRFLLIIRLFDLRKLIFSLLICKFKL